MDVFAKKIDVRIAPRPDGGVRISSVDEPGLILSGRDPWKTIAMVGPALKALADHRSAQEASR